nr:MAG TPA: hypothetical protein [Caudoviricetes sp.]
MTYGEREAWETPARQSHCKDNTFQQTSKTTQYAGGNQGNI